MAIEFLSDYQTIGILILIVSSIVAGTISGLGGASGPIIMTVFLLVFDLSPQLVAGTSSTIFFLGALTGGLAYISSRDVDWVIVLVMTPTLIIGTQIGTFINPYLSTQLFSIVLAFLMVVLGVNILYRETRELRPLMHVDVDRIRGKVILSVLALGTGVFSGATGFGGPGIIIPALMILGIPALYAVGSGMVQGIFITSATSLNYIFDGNVDFALVLVSGVPFVIMLVTGWKIAHYIVERKLKIAIGIILFLLAPSIIVLS